MAEEDGNKGGRGKETNDGGGIGPIAGWQVHL